MDNFIKATSLQNIDCLIQDLGGEYDVLFSRCQVAINMNALERQYLPYRHYINLLEVCAKELDCPDFGLRLASRQTFGILGPIALVAQTGTTLEEVMGWVIKYLHLHCPAISLQINPCVNEDELFLSFEILLTPLPQINQVIELSIGLIVGIIRQLSDGKCQPKQIFLPQKSASNLRAYHQYFSCPIVDLRNIAGVVVAKQDLQLAVNSYQLSQVSTSWQFLSKQDAQKLTLPDQVALLVKSLLAIDQCSNENVSRILLMQPRQLHRLLTNYQTSFVKIKNQQRKLLAWHYLRESQLSIGHISELLGYQEQATLSAACRRWFGQSPRVIRHASQ